MCNNSCGCLFLFARSQEPSRDEEDLPREVDWRKHNILNGVRSQGYSGCCWAMATAGVIEAVYNLKNHTHVQLSPQELLDKVDPNNDTKDEWGYPCSPAEALEWVMHEGISKEEHYPFKGKLGTPLPKQSSEAINIQNFKCIKAQKENEILQVVAKHPVTANIKNYPDLRAFPGGTIYKGPPDWNVEWGRHIVMIVGYGTEGKTKYWIVRNSYGERWGDQGYAKIVRDSSLPKGCSLLYGDACYPTFENFNDY